MNRKLVETWLGAEALMFTIAAVIHSGVAQPFVGQRPLIAAAIVEVVCAIMLVAAAVAVHRDAPFARRAALAAHGVAIGSVGLGLLALWIGLAANTTLGVAYQRGMFGLLLAMFLLLASPLGTIAFRRAPAKRHARTPDWDDWYVTSQGTSKSFSP